MGSETPITPVLCGDEGITQQMERKLYEAGVFVVGIVYPTVPRGKARVRTMPNATHTQQDLDDALEAFEKVGKELGVISRWV
jgi:glycine C-acetyltransferase